MNVYEVLSTLKKLSKSSGFASPSLDVSVVQSIGSWGQPFEAFTGFEFVIFGPWKRQDRFCKFISMEAGGEKWWTGGYGWETNTLQPFVHLWSEINTVRVEIRHRCTSLPLLCHVFHCLYLIDHYPPVVVWKRWGQTHFMENRCSMVCKLSNASQNQGCHLSDSLAIFLKFQCTFEAHLNGWHWLDGGRCRADFSARSTAYFWEFSDRMASEEEKAARKCPVKFELASKFGRIVTPLMSVGFQPIQEFSRISRCWDAEDQRDLCVVVWAASDVFWTRRTRLLQEHLMLLNMVEISDFEIPCFGSVFSDPSFRVLVVVRSSYPSLWYIFSTSPFPMLHWAHQTAHPNQWAVSVFHYFRKKGTFLVQKKTFTRFFAPNIIIFHIFFIFFFTFSLILSSFSPFFDVFSTFLRKISSPEASAAASTWRPGTATSRPCGTSSAWRRSACTRKIRLAGGLKRLRLNCGFAGGGGKVGLKVPEEIFKILKFGVNRNLDFSMLGFELPDY